MDLVWLLELIGEAETLLVCGTVIGLVFGMLAQRTGFCTRSAVIALVDGTNRATLSLWLIAFAVALAGSQALLATGLVDLSETRFFATPQSLSGAAAGGALFGVGMMLARGCASRLVVLGASGNIRAIVTVAILAATAWAAIEGFASPLRFAVNGLWSTAWAGGNDIAMLAGFTGQSGLIVGAVLALAAIVLSVRAGFGLAASAAGVAIGLTIPAGWYLTYSLSQQVFEPVQAMSLTYIAPLAGLAGFATDGDSSRLLTAETGFVAGTAIGALAAALASRSFSVETFASRGAAPLWRYVAGGLLMGLGGVMAAGCTIGAGFTGGSVLALASLLALLSMIAAAAATHRLLDSTKSTWRNTHVMPAE